VGLLSRIFSRLTPSRPSGTTFTILRKSHTGKYIDEETALTLSAVWASVRVIAESVASVPWRVMIQEGGRKRIVPGPVDRMLRASASPEMSAYTWKETALLHALLWGNHYSEIARDTAGRAVGLYPIEPHRVRPDRDADGRLVYAVSMQEGGEIALDPSQVYHLHGLGFDGLQGYSVIRMAAQTVGLGLACEEFGARFFGNGATSGMTLHHPGQLSDAARKNLKESFAKTEAGLANSHGLRVVEEGAKLEPIGIPPEDAQFLETRKFQVAEVARWFRVPPHKIGDLEKATFSNIEQQSIEFVSDTLLPWAVRMEQEADRKLVSAPFFTKVELKGVLRGDSKSRGEFYRTLFSLGAISPNEIRQLEDMNPVGPEGDKLLVQLNLTTLEKAGEEPEPAEPNPQLPPPEASHRVTLLDAATRAGRREERALAEARDRYAGDPAGFEEWAGRWYRGHTEAVWAYFEAPLTALLLALGRPDVTAADVMGKAFPVMAEGIARSAEAPVDYSKRAEDWAGLLLETAAEVVAR